MEKPFVIENSREIFGEDIGNFRLVVCPDNTVNLVRLGERRFLRPIKKIDRISQVSLENLFHYMIGNFKEVALIKLYQKLLAVYQEDFSGVGTKVKKDFGENICDSLKKKFESEINKAKENQKSRCQKKSIELIQRTSDKNLERFKKDMIAGARKAVDESISDFRNGILLDVRGRFLESKNSFDKIAQSTVLPAGTKFFFSKGDTTMLIIEQPPAVRTIAFSKEFLVRDKTSTFQRKSNRFQLAFPYTIFVLYFDQGRLSYMKLFYTVKPLSSNEDPLYLPNLPNIYEEGEICLNLPGSQRMGLITKQAEQAISHFWQSEFNRDLIGNYKRQKEKDVRFRDVWQWQKESAKNPLFVLEVEWLKSKYTLRILFEREFAREVENEKLFFDNLIEKAIEKKEDGLGKVIQQYFESVKVEKRYSESVVAQVKICLDTTLDEIFSHLTNSLNKGTLKNEKNEIAERFNRVTISVIGKILKERFEQLSNEALIQQRVSARELIEKIRR